MASREQWRARSQAYFGRARAFLRARLDPKSHLGLGLTLRLALFALAVWAFSGLLDAVLDNETLVRIDRWVAAWFNAHATPTGRAVFNVITQLGSPVVWALMVIVALYLLLTRDRPHFLTWVAATGGGKLLEYVIKNTVHRSRPEYSAAYLHGQSYSFPSGHTMGSTICYLLLAYLIARRPGVSRRIATLVNVAAVAVIIVVGLSRLYLVVHYLSDVLGGVAAGLAWLAACGATRTLVLGRREAEQAGAHGARAASA